MNEPYFPLELEQQIFKLAFRNPSINRVALLLTAKRVQKWIEPLLYHSINLERCLYDAPFTKKSRPTKLDLLIRTDDVYSMFPDKHLKLNRTRSAFKTSPKSFLGNPSKSHSRGYVDDDLESNLSSSESDSTSEDSISSSVGVEETSDDKNWNHIDVLSYALFTLISADFCIVHSKDWDSLVKLMSYVGKANIVNELSECTIVLDSVITIDMNVLEDKISTAAKQDENAAGLIEFESLSSSLTGTLEEHFTAKKPFHWGYPKIPPSRSPSPSEHLDRLSSDSYPTSSSETKKGYNSSPTASPKSINMSSSPLVLPDREHKKMPSNEMESPSHPKEDFSPETYTQPLPRPASKSIKRAKSGTSLESVSPEKQPPANVASHDVQGDTFRRRIKNAKYKCPRCPADFTSNYNLQNHLNSHYSTGEVCTEVPGDSALASQLSFLEQQSVFLDILDKTQQTFLLKQLIEYFERQSSIDADTTLPDDNVNFNDVVNATDKRPGLANPLTFDTSTVEPNSSSSTSSTQSVFLALHPSSNHVLGRQKRSSPISPISRTGSAVSSSSVEPDNSNPVTSVALDSDWLVVAFATSEIQVYSAQTGRLTRTLTGHRMGVWAVSLVSRGGRPMESTTESEHVHSGLEATGETYSGTRSDPSNSSEGWGQPGPLIISGGSDRVVGVWDILKGKCNHLMSGHSATIRCIKTLHSRPLAVSGSRDATLRVWDINKGRLIRTLSGHREGVSCMDVCGNRVVSGSYDATCRMWNVDTGECLGVFSGHSQRIYSVVFDGVRIASGGLDATTRLWDAQSGACIRTLSSSPAPVLFLQMAPSLNHLASASSDGTVVVYDLSSLEPVQSLQPHSATVTALQFESQTNNDATVLLTADNDGLVKRFDVRSQSFLRPLCGQSESVWKVLTKGDVCAVVCQRSGRVTVEIWSTRSK